MSFVSFSPKLRDRKTVIVACCRRRKPQLENPSFRACARWTFQDRALKRRANASTRLCSLFAAYKTQHDMKRRR